MTKIKRSTLTRVLRVALIPVVSMAYVLLGVGRAASVSDLAASADAVVLARALGWSTETSGVTRLLLRVERDLSHSDISAGEMISAAGDLNGPTVRTQMKTESPIGVWFLNRDADGWTVVAARGGQRLGFRDLYYPIRVADTDSWSEALEQDDVVLSVAHALRESGTHPWFVQEAIGEDDSPAVRAFFEQMSEDQDVRSMLVGLSELLTRGDVEALARLKRYQSVIESDPGGFGRLVPQAIESFFRNTESNAVHLLGTLANDVGLQERLREAVAHALAWIHTRESLPHLAGLLDDDNPNLRRSAVIGLSLFANGVGVQRPSDGPSMKHLNDATPNSYSSEETRQYLGFDETRATEFVAFWKDWWLKREGEF